MVKTFQAYLPPKDRTYSCVHCRAHLASHDELISKVVSWILVNLLILRLFFVISVIPRESRPGILIQFCVSFLSFQTSVPFVIMHLCRVNVACGQAEERVLLTGLHAVADIYCECCKTPLGWKYVSILCIQTEMSFSIPVVSGGGERVT